jgi:hypothetical protein
MVSSACYIFSPPPPPHHHPFLLLAWPLFHRSQQTKNLQSLPSSHSLSFFIYCQLFFPLLMSYRF